MPHPGEILAAVGDVTYEWSLADDSLRWSDNAAAVLKLAASDQIATGRGFARLVEATSPSNRHDVIFNGGERDRGQGVAYQVQYCLRSSARDSHPVLWVEDVGRWYAGPDGTPARAHGILRVINDRYERERRLVFLSHYDELTGCLNRARFLTVLGEVLTTASRFDRSFALLIVCLDNFSNINHAYGFDVADQVLVAVASRLRSHVRDGDAVGRYSGNKLGVILMNCGEAEIRGIAERFHATIRDNVVTTDAGPVAITVSIGAVSLPAHGRTIDRAVVCAQEALHDARQKGFGRFCIYSESAAREIRHRSNAALSTELVSALNERRFCLAFQPIIDIATGSAHSYEALLRLRRANGTLTPASDFIALAENLGLVRLIDFRALELTLDALGRYPDACISLNVSGETVGDTEWLEHLSASIARSRSLARRLTIEITETAVISNLGEVADFIHAIHALGCLVALDDFGAGYTSFRNLRDLDVDLVKIDGSFVENLPKSRDDQAFVRALVDLARNFGKTTVAEWVQDAETVSLLKVWGVDRIQGNFAGAALPELPSTLFAG
jgi:diguanylate cyclase (GGDEF)-like protein